MALKTCPACKKQSGPRTKTCECGHAFITEMPAVKASVEPMKNADVDPLDKRIAESVSIARNVLARVDERRGMPPSVTSTLTRRTEVTEEKKASPVDNLPERRTQIAPEERSSIPMYYGRTIVVPAGIPPFKPKGYKEGWPDGPASEEVIAEWAKEIFESNERYAPDVVIYWMRYFWDIHNKPEFNRVRELVIRALS